MRMRTPAFCHSDQTYLGCMKFEFGYLESMLYLLKERNLLDNPIERIKYITCAQLASIHTGILSGGLKTPLNPILGETCCLRT